MKKIIVKNLAEIPYINDTLDDEIRDYLTITNPKWLENQRMNRWQGKTPKQLMFYEEIGDKLLVPRGAIEAIMQIHTERNINIKVIDKTILLSEVDFNFKGRLWKFQKEATAEALLYEEGTLSSPTGSGKTVMALYMIAKRKQSCLIIVHTKTLLKQWIKRIEYFFGIPKEEIGIIGNSKNFVGEKITVGMVQTLREMKQMPKIGHLISDEDHRVPADTFYKVIKKFDCQYLLGLSATPFRPDGLTDLIYWYVGPIRHEISLIKLIKEGYLKRIEPIIRKTDFTSSLKNPSSNYPKFLAELTKDKQRNTQITNDIVKEVHKGKFGLVLTDRKAHCETLKKILISQDIKVGIINSDQSEAKQEQAVEDINAGNINMIIATGKGLGEGFDCDNLSCLFLTVPVKFDGLLLQYIGRVIRFKKGIEKAQIYDYFDRNIKCVYGSYTIRQKVYKELTSL